MTLNLQAMCLNSTNVGMLMELSFRNAGMLKTAGQHLQDACIISTVATFSMQEVHVARVELDDSLQLGGKAVWKLRVLPQSQGKPRVCKSGCQWLSWHKGQMCALAA